MLKEGRTGKFLKKFHVYGGLFLSFYVIILGISSLQFQHRLFQFEPSEKSVSWEQHFHLPETVELNQLKSTIQDSLGLNGFLPWWEEYTDSSGVYHFMISRPGKQYWIAVTSGEDRVLVKEHRTAFLSVVFALHPLTAGFEGPGYAKLWRVISEIMSVLLLMVIVLSIQMWYARSFTKRRSWIIAGSIASFSILLIILVWLVG